MNDGDRHSDVALGYYLPSDGKSEGRSPALDHGSSEVHRRPQKVKSWIGGVGSLLSVLKIVGHYV